MACPINTPLPNFISFMVILLLPYQFTLCVGTFSSEIKQESQLQISCQQTDYPDTCISVLRQNPQSLRANHTEICRISMVQTAALASDTSDYISMLLKGSIGQDLRQNLTNCFDSYKDAANRVSQKGLRAFDVGCYATVDQILATVVVAAGECNKIKGIPKPLQRKNTVLFQFSIDASDLVESLPKFPFPPPVC